MDGALIATIIASSITLSTAIGGGFWKLITKIDGQNKVIGEQNEAISHMEGKIEGKMDVIDTRLHSYEKQLEGFDNRVNRLDKRINGLLDNIILNNITKDDDDK